MDEWNRLKSAVEPLAPKLAMDSQFFFNSTNLVFQILIWDSNSELNSLISSLPQQKTLKAKSMATEQEAAETAQQEIEATEQEQQSEQAYTPAEESAEHKQEGTRLRNSLNNHGERSNFVHGLSVGLGIGCIATFVIIWISVFFTPQLPEAITYESMLAVFIYPLIYLLAVGLVSLTAGIVREYYGRH